MSFSPDGLLLASGTLNQSVVVWDLMRGVDVLLKQPTIDKDRIILLGAVAGGGDPAGVTAALDPRIACVVPFNFGGWQPESRVLENPDRDFEWFGDGYWESTRGLYRSISGGFFPWVIVGSVAPRRLIHAHEFAWDMKRDPVFKRYQTLFDWYKVDGLAAAYGLALGVRLGRSFGARVPARPPACDVGHAAVPGAPRATPFVAVHVRPKCR